MAMLQRHNTVGSTSGIGTSWVLVNFGSSGQSALVAPPSSIPASEEQLGPVAPNQSDHPIAIMPPTLLPPLEGYLSKATESYVTCLDSIGDEAVDGVQATARFHHLKIDPVSGKPMFRELAKLLAAQLVNFSFNSRRVAAAVQPHELQLLHQDARDLLRESATSGEPGEILAYFLIEAVLGAPQMIAKLELKTNTNLETFGADGVHIRWNEADEMLEVICAESKLEDQPSDAISHCAKSVAGFHKNEAYRHELSLATAHFKHANDDFKGIVGDILKGKAPAVRWRLRHACLAGYDWAGYANLPGKNIKEVEAAFKQRYADEKPRLQKLLKTHFGAVEQPLILFDVFLLPFGRVQDFRDAFLAAV